MEKKPEGGLSPPPESRDSRRPDLKPLRLNACLAVHSITRARSASACEVWQRVWTEGYRSLTHHRSQSGWENERRGDVRLQTRRMQSVAHPHPSEPSHASARAPCPSRTKKKTAGRGQTRKQTSSSGQRQALTTAQNEVMAPRGGACRTARATAEQAVLPAWSRLSPPGRPPMNGHKGFRFLLNDRTYSSILLPPPSFPSKVLTRNSAPTSPGLSSWFP